jgi:hypothetical protein
VIFRLVRPADNTLAAQNSNNYVSAVKLEKVSGKVPVRLFSFRERTSLRCSTDAAPVHSFVR